MGKSGDFLVKTDIGGNFDNLILRTFLAIHCNILIIDHKHCWIRWLNFPTLPVFTWKSPHAFDHTWRPQWNNLCCLLVPCFPPSPSRSLSLPIGRIYEPRRKRERSRGGADSGFGNCRIVAFGNFWVNQLAHMVLLCDSPILSPVGLYPNGDLPVLTNGMSFSQESNSESSPGKRNSAQL